MPRGYFEGSKMSNALEFLAVEGIDCIRIGCKKMDGFKTVYFPINTLISRNFLDDIYNSNEGFLTDDFLRIETDYMRGDEIKELNPKLSKLEDEKLYDVIKISYIDPRPLYIPDKSYNPFWDHKPISQ